MIEPLLQVFTSRPALSARKEIFGLKPGRSNTPPQPVLSEQILVAVQDELGVWALNNEPFLFNAEFQKFVGGCLPMGVGPHRPAMIAAIRRYKDDWAIVACYLDMTYPKLLWREQELAWIRGGNRGSTEEEVG